VVNGPRFAVLVRRLHKRSTTKGDKISARSLPTLGLARLWGPDLLWQRRVQSALRPPR
jgi:hypothetical protein